MPSNPAEAQWPYSKVDGAGPTFGNVDAGVVLAVLTQGHRVETGLAVGFRERLVPAFIERSSIFGAVGHWLFAGSSKLGRDCASEWAPFAIVSGCGGVVVMSSRGAGKANFSTPAWVDRRSSKFRLAGSRLFPFARQVSGRLPPARPPAALGSGSRGSSTDTRVPEHPGGHTQVGSSILVGQELAVSVTPARPSASSSGGPAA